MTVRPLKICAIGVLFIPLVQAGLTVGGSYWFYYLGNPTITYEAWWHTTVRDLIVPDYFGRLSGTWNFAARALSIADAKSLFDAWAGMLKVFNILVQCGLLLTLVGLWNEKAWSRLVFTITAGSVLALALLPALIGSMGRARINFGLVEDVLLTGIWAIPLWLMYRHASLKEAFRKISEQKAKVVEEPLKRE